MPRGGPRPGAGAPVGNLNALVHGRSSRRVRGLLDLLLTIPEVRTFLLALWARSLDGPPAERRRQLKALSHLMDSIARENKPCPEPVEGNASAPS